MLEKIQNHALTGKNHAGVMADYGDLLAFLKTHAVENFTVDRHLIVRVDGGIELLINIENAGDTAEAGENAILLGENRRNGALVWINAGRTGGVARGAIFLQRVFDDGGQPPIIPFHGFFLKSLFQSA